MILLPEQNGKNVLLSFGREGRFFSFLRGEKQTIRQNKQKTGQKSGRNYANHCVIVNIFRRFSKMLRFAC